MKKLLAAFGLILVLSMALAACGGSSSSGGNTLNITMTDFAFAPNTWSVAAGSTVTVTLKNNGAVQHNWTVMSKPVSRG